MIQGGDPNTKDPDLIEAYGGREDRDIKLMKNLTPYNTTVALFLWQGVIIQIVQAHNFLSCIKIRTHLDGEYTVFGRLVPGLPNALNHIASLETDDNNAPLDLLETTIITAKILDPYTSANISTPDRNQSVI